jgi:hypothetical protein
MPDGRSFWFPSRKNLVGAMAAWKLPEIDLNWPRLQRVWFSTKSAFGGKADMTLCGNPLSRSLLGVKRTCHFALQMSANDPKRTSVHTHVRR